ncbi:MAG: [cytidine(C)-cytidine(C)-adenosine (A)]-adding enzyme [Cyanobacteria bacterium QS_8_64_29]|nr:MAG: [cytidine(C)-cytidine(C)-adenosine (A)]-adding enzyme [Cyanobacteria bacterium QS_8_64_29]
MPSSLEATPLSPQQWPFNLSWLPPQAHLVGGAVRDALLARRQSPLDLDFIVCDGAIETARAIARHYGAGFVVLDAGRQIARVVFAGGTVDFACLEGATLAADLARRDFTVNAIAYEPRAGAIVDPLQGQADLERRCLRMVAAANLQADPLRLLRAYRLAAQLDFAIEAQTRATIRRWAPQLARVAAERVQTELRYLLRAPAGNAWLKAAGADGVLSAWLPDADAAALECAARVDGATRWLSERWPSLAPELHAPLTNDPTACWPLLAKFASLAAPSADRAQAQLAALGLSRAEVRSAATAVRHWARVAAAPRSIRAQFELFRAVGAAFPGVALLVAAAGSDRAAITQLLDRYAHPGDPVAHPHSPVSGRDLMRALGLSPSPQIGELLTEIQLARACGDIATAEEALAWAASWLGQRAPKTGD